MANSDHNTAIRAIIGARIKTRRTELSISQRLLSDRTATPLGILQRCERGEGAVDSDALYRIAQYLDTPITYFYGGDVLDLTKRDHREALLLRYYDRLSQRMRISALALVRALAHI